MSDEYKVHLDVKRYRSTKVPNLKNISSPDLDITRHFFSVFRLRIEKKVWE